MLIYVSSRVHVRVIWWIEVCLCRSLVKDHIDTVQPRALLKGLSASCFLSGLLAIYFFFNLVIPTLHCKILYIWHIKNE